MVVPLARAPRQSEPPSGAEIPYAIQDFRRLLLALFNSRVKIKEGEWIDDSSLAISIVRSDIRILIRQSVVSASAEVSKSSREQYSGFSVPGSQHWEVWCTSSSGSIVLIENGASVRFLSVSFGVNNPHNPNNSVISLSTIAQKIGCREEVKKGITRANVFVCGNGVYEDETSPEALVAMRLMHKYIAERLPIEAVGTMAMVG